jgi:hypothetical protein
MELIDRTALLEKSYYRGRPATVDHLWGDGAEVVDVEDIEAMPVIDAAPVVHGRWVKGDGSYTIYCSNCKNDAYWDTDYGPQEFDYCPYCGAKMDLEE